MRANAAKQNPLVFDQAIKHYLTQGKPTPEFTFMSLWNDAEPYPLAEEINTAGERLALLQANFKEQPTDSLKRETHAFLLAHKRLVHLQNTHKGAE